MKVYRLPYFIHPDKDDAWLARQKEENTEDEVAREVLISYDFSVAGVVFKELKDSHINRKPYEFNKTWQTLVGFDFGRTGGSLFIQVDNYDCLHVFKEIVLVGQGTSDLAAVTKAYASKLDCGDWFYYCDPAGNSPDHRTKTTDIKILDSEGFRPMHFEKALAMPKRKLDGIQMVKKFLNERISGRERITIYEQGCPTLIEAMQSGYRYKENNRGETQEVVDEVHPYEDVVDLLRYALIERFTITPKTKKKDGVIVHKGLNKSLGRV